MAGRGPLFIAIGIALLGVILVVIFAIFLLRSGNEDGGTADGGTELQATAVVDGGNGGVESGAAGNNAGISSNLVVVGVSNAATISVTLETPVSLRIGGNEFQVQAISVPAGERWQPTIPSNSSAMWVYGSVINYAIGLADTSNNRAMLDSLTPGDEIALTTQDGTVSLFTFDRREIVPASSPEIFNQTSPGITLVLLGTSGDNRLMIHGRYIAPQASTAPVEEAQIELGETAQLDNLVATVTAASQLFDRPEAPPGFAFYLIDYELENVGGQPINLNQLSLSLSDQFGNQYAISPVAAQFGTYPAAVGSLGAGQKLSATAGYQIPASLSDGRLRWVIQPAANAGKIEVTLTLGNAASGEDAIVSLLSAEVSLDGTSLSLTGQISNLSNTPLIVEENAVRLTSAGTVYLLFSTNPGFPWVIGAGQTIPFALMFQRPQQQTALFEVIGFPFELNGLR